MKRYDLTDYGVEERKQPRMKQKEGIRGKMKLQRVYSELPVRFHRWVDEMVGSTNYDWFRGYPPGTVFCRAIYYEFIEKGGLEMTVELQEPEVRDTTARVVPRDYPRPLVGGRVYTKRFVGFHKIYE